MKKGPIEVVMTGDGGRSLVAEAEAKEFLRSLEGDIVDRLIGLSDVNYALGFYTEVIIIEDAISEIKNLRKQLESVTK